MKKINKKIDNLFSLITVFLFVLLLIVTCVLFFVLPKKEESEIEKRKLEEFPEFSLESFTDGSFTDNITKYVSDNFVARDKLVELSYTLEDMRGIRVDGVKLYSGENNNEIIKEMIDPEFFKVRKPVLGIQTPLLGEDARKLISFETVVENTEIYDNLNKEDVIGQQVGALFIIEDTALEIFYGNNSIISDYVNIINAYRLAIPQNINIYSMVVPTHFEFGLPEKYKSQVGTPQKPFIDSIYSSLDPSIKKVDAYSSIKKDYFEGNYMYFRTDHHWTARGAYSAYTELAKVAEFEATPLSDFETRKIDRFLGTFHSSTFDKKLSANPDFIEFYAPTNSYSVTNYDKDGNITTTNGTLVYKSVKGDSNGYLVFMGGDIPLSVIETDVKNSRSIIVFKESYGNAFVPFLTRNFEKIYVADIRTFPFNAVDFVINQNITDVLFLNNIMTSCSPPRIKNYLTLMQNK